VGTSFGTSLLESGCEFCGACIDVCPVGALVERDHKWEKARRVERSICPHCPVGCQLNLEFNGKDELIRAVPEINSPANQGQACFKGKFGLEFVNDASRLTTPLIRQHGVLEEASWDEALEFVASRLSQVSGEQFALLTSPTSTNEEHYLAQKFARVVMESNNIDQTSNTNPELVLGLETALGFAAGTNPIWELEQSGCILAFNTNVTEQQNVVAVPIKRAARKNTKLVVIDSREVELTRYAHMWLRPVPGTELTLLAGVLRSIVDQGLEREEWLEENCESPATLRYALRSREIDEISETTQVSAEDIAEAARLFAQADSGSVVYGLDNVPPEQERDCVISLVNLVLLTGNLGKPGAGLYPMRQGTNEQGAWDMGCVPDRLPGYLRVSEPSDREAVEAAWGVSLPETTGLGLSQIVEAAGNGDLKAAIVVGNSPNFTNGRLGDALEAFSKLDLLVVHETFLTPLAQRADVVLPRTTFAEKDGTFTNLERRIQRVRPSVSVKNNDAMPEGWILSQLAERLGIAGIDYSEPAVVMDEIAAITPAYAGVSYDRLAAESALVMKTGMESPRPTQLLYTTREERGIQWPCANVEAPSSPILYGDGFPGGRAEPGAPYFRIIPTPVNERFTAMLAPGRVLLQRDRDMQIEPDGLNRVIRDELVQLNPGDATNWGIRDEDPVTVDTARSRITGIASVDAGIPAGVVGITTLFGQLAVELQMSEDINPMARVPGLDVEPCRVIALA
jgi:predicted molibdopterin-dependent oxidoreductase YjgC